MMRPRPVLVLSLLLAAFIGCSSDGSGSSLSNSGGGGGSNAPPILISIAPTAGPTAGNTTVTITGSGFTTSGLSASLGGTDLVSITVVNDTTITATTPPGSAGNVNLVVNNSVGGDALNVAFTYVDPPVLSLISPPEGIHRGGVGITLTAQNLFAPDTQVTIGGVAVTNLSLQGTGSATANTPALSSGTKDVVLTTPGGQVTLAGGFKATPLPLGNPSPTNIDEFGTAIAAGDLDNDGDSDIVVGVPGANGEGRIIVFFSNGNGQFNTSTTLQEPTTEAGARFGAAVAIGDVDGDNFDDVVVGAPGAASGAGEVFVFISNGNFTFQAAITLVEAVQETNAAFGATVAVGDVNNDNNDDLVIGAPGSDLPGNADAGEAFLLLSNGAGAFPTVTTITDPNDEANAAFGSAITLSDVDDDNDDDVVIGAPGSDVGGNAGAGEVFVFLADGAGGLGAPLLLADTTPEVGAAFGSSVASGDINSDNFFDLVIGSPGASNGEGEAVVFVSDGLGAFPTSTVLQEPTAEANANFGASVACADLNNDNRDDVLVGASGADPGGNNESGEGFVFFPDALGAFPTTTTLTDADQQAGARVGSAAVVADIDNDGFGDVILGADRLNVTQSGEVLIYFGPTP